MVASKEENLILNDGTSQRASELIALQRVAFLCKKVPGIESRIADKLKRVTVQLVGARLGDGVDRPARFETAVGAHTAGLDLEFLQGVGEWQRHLCTVVRIVMHRSIQGIPDAKGLPACNRDQNCTLPRLRVCSSRLDRGASQRNQVSDLASVQGKFENPLIFDDLADRCGSRFDLSRIGLNLNLFRNLSDSKYGIDNRSTVHLQNNAAFCKRSESWQRRFQSIWT